jgi:hypothetical protein
MQLRNALKGWAVSILLHYAPQGSTSNILHFLKKYFTTDQLSAQNCLFDLKISPVCRVITTAHINLCNLKRSGDFEGYKVLTKFCWNTSNFSHFNSET